MSKRKNVSRKTGGGIRKTDACTLHLAGGLVTIDVREDLNGDVLVKFRENGLDGPRVLVADYDAGGTTHYRFWRKDD